MSGFFLINADNYELSSFHSTSNNSQQNDVILSKEDFTTWESIPYRKIKLSINNDQYSLQLVYYFLYDTHVSEDFDILVLKISWFVIRQSSRNGPCSEIIFMNNLTNYTQSFFKKICRKVFSRNKRLFVKPKTILLPRIDVNIVYFLTIKL